MTITDINKNEINIQNKDDNIYSKNNFQLNDFISILSSQNFLNFSEIENNKD